MFKNFIFDLQRFADIHNYDSNTLVSGTSGNDTIYNWESSNVTISGGAGNDYIDNYRGSNVSISGDAGNDEVYNSGSNVTINGGAGDDSIYIDSNSDGVSIDGGAGNDSIHNNYADNVTINGGDGHDSIYNEGSGSTIDGGAGNDSIWNNGATVTIDAGAGDDSIDNDGSNVTINGGAGNDRIDLGSLADENVIIYNEGDGNDLIEGFDDNSTLSISGSTYYKQRSGSDIIITVGKGKITLQGAADRETLNIAGEELVGEEIFNYEKNSLISGTAYSDSIYNYADKITISAKALDDYIFNSGANVSISGGAGSDSIDNSGSKVTINGGNDNDSIYNNEGSNVKINASNGDDYIWNNGATVTIDAGDGNDAIYNEGNDVTINAGAGDDTIENRGNNVSIDAGDGNNYIQNYWVNNTTIISGAGNDTIYNSSSNVSIDAGDGDDYISNGNYRTTISGGKGNDTIYNNSDDALFLYSAGDGNDLIQGFKADNLFIIAADNYSTKKSGRNVLITVGDNKITLEGAASLSALKIGTKEELLNVIGTEDNDELDDSRIQALGGNSGTINALGGDDTITNESSNVSISGGEGNDEIRNYDDDWNTPGGSNVTINGGDGADYIENRGANVSISGGAGNDSISNWYGYNVTISGGIGNDTIINDNEGFFLFKYAEGDGNDLIQGFMEDSTLSIGDGKGTYSVAKNGSDLIITVGDGKITLMGAADLSTINISGTDKTEPVWNHSGTTATYSTWKKTLATVSGVKSAKGLSVNNKVVTVSDASLNQAVVTISKGYTLALADDVTVPVKAEANWSAVSSGKATYNFYSTTAGYTLANNKISYTKEIAPKSLTVDGIKSTDGITVSGTTVTLTAANLNKSAVTISDGYNLKLAKDVSSPVATKAGWSKVSSGKATYNFDSTTEGYTLANNQISYTAPIEAKSFTLSGIKSTSGITIDGTTVTLSAANLNKSDVTISDGYTLKLASDVSAPSKTSAVWSAVSSGKATYKYETMTAGYTLADNKISYTAAITPKSFKITGIKSTDGIKVDGTTVTLTADNLNMKTVTISDGYTLKLADDVAAPVETKANWSKISSGKATYNYDSMTAGYTLADNKITYTKAVAVKSFTVSGIKSTDGIKVDGKTVTLTADNLNKKSVKISDGYTLALGKDVDKPTTKKAAWTLNKDSIATYKSPYQTEGYKLADNIITYSKATTAETLATVKGVTSTDGLKVSGSTIKLAGSALANNVTVSGDYNFDFAADYNNATITGSSKSDAIIARGKNISVDGDKGDDTIKMLGTGSITGGKGNDLFYYKSIATNVITDYAKGDKISIASGTVSVAIKDKDVVLSKKITVAGGADKTIIYTDKKGEHTYPTVKIDGKTITLTENYFEEKFNVANYGNALQTIDASAVVHDLNITGNKLANQITGSGQDDTIDGGAGSDSIFGGKGADILLGGKGDDVIEGGAGNDTLTGGAGADVFVYNKGDGNDTITDYAEEDLIKIVGDTVEKFTKKNDNVIFTLASKKKITITGGADKIISYVDKNGEDTYPEIVKFNAKGTAATLTANYNRDEFNIADYDDYKESVVTINAADVNQDISIIGNKKNNKVFGGAGNDSIYGGAGNDTLSGGKGSDVFVYNKGDGNDVISDYEEDDSIKIIGDSVAKTTKKNKNVIFTLASKKKITVTNGADKVISYSDDSGDYTYPDIVKFNDKGTEATLTANYIKDEFNIADYEDYKDSILTIDASAVKHDLKITANKNANKIIGSSQDDSINGGEGADTLEGGKGNDTLEGGKGNDKLYGGAGDDTLWGGAGSDTLYGGAGHDTFIYQNGDGKDVIADYDSLDTIMILSGNVGGYTVGKSNVTFKIGSGSLVVENGKNQYIELVDTSRKPLTHYSPKG